MAVWSGDMGQGGGGTSLGGGGFMSCAFAGVQQSSARVRSSETESLRVHAWTLGKGWLLNALEAKELASSMNPRMPSRSLHADERPSSESSAGYDEVAECLPNP